jgi:hypothetical protein
MAIGDYELVGRAARILRDAPEPGWQAIEDDVITAVRSTPRSGWPLDVMDPAPGATGALRVSDLVVRIRLLDALSGDTDYVATEVDVVSAETTLHGVAVRVTGRYGADLRAAASRAERACRAVVADVVGTDVGVTISVTVADLQR